MPLTGNKGEWSEVYAFLRLLADGKLFAADEQLNKISDMFFPIIKIIREEIAGTPYEYYANQDSAEIEIYLNDEQMLRVPVSVFDDEANHLFSEAVAASGAFRVERTEAFMSRIYLTKLKAPNSDTSDIKIQLHDINTGYENVVGFSIKSDIGSPPTLLNAGKTTNFVFAVEGLDAKHIEHINAIDTQTKIIDRINAIFDNGGKLYFRNMANETFKNNLTMIDSQMPIIVAEMLVGYYSGIASDCGKLTDYVSRTNPLSLSPMFYKQKIRDMLCAMALGMKPATQWDGTDEASGGYIIVKSNGDVLAYHLYNRDAFRGYLLRNTKLERASTTRHEYGALYQDGDKIKINLNLQIRFI